MLRTRATVIGLVTLGLGVTAVGVANADPGSGGTSVVIGSGQAEDSFQIRQRAGNDVVMVQNTFAPGGFSGWHSHPGLVLIIVQSGQITIFRERVTGGRCRVHTYQTGEVFLEHPGDEQNGVNRGTVPAVVAVTFFNVPHATSTRIERTAPTNCPA